MPKVPQRIKVNGRLYVKAEDEPKSPLWEEDPKEELMLALEKAKDSAKFLQLDLDSVAKNPDDPSWVYETVSRAMRAYYNIGSNLNNIMYDTKKRLEE